jgi:hypothetical protein
MRELKSFPGTPSDPPLDEATPLDPYKALGLLVGLFSHCQKTSYVFTKSWGQVDFFLSRWG